jgi:hypothetical protein
VAYIHAKQAVPYQDAYRYIHSYFPSMRDYEDILRGCLSAGYIKLEQRDGAQFLVAGKPLEATTAAHEAVLKA